MASGSWLLTGFLVRWCEECGLLRGAEVAYLSLQETGLKLAGVMDDGRIGEAFFGVPVCSIADGVSQVKAPLVISSL